MKDSRTAGKHTATGVAANSFLVAFFSMLIPVRTGRDKARSSGYTYPRRRATRRTNIKFDI